MNSKVCFVINKPVSGGAEGFLLRLTQSIKDDINCYVIFLDSEGSLKEEFLLSGVHISFLDIRTSPISLIKGIKKLILLIKEINPDIIHTFLPISDLLGGIAAKYLGVKNIYWSIRQSNISLSQNNIHSYLLIRVCGLLSWLIPDKIISCSSMASSNHKKYAFYKSSIIFELPNGFDQKKFFPSKGKRAEFRLNNGINDKQKVMALVARYDVQKGVDNFIKICQRVSIEIKEDLVFLFVGSRLSKSNLKLIELLQEYNISKKSILLDEQRDLCAVYNGADLIVIPSRGEAFPNVLGEAMSVGTPVVTTNVGEMPVILEGIQECYKPENIKEMANRSLELLSLSDDKKDTYTIELQKRIKSRYEIHLVMNKYKRLYASIE